MKNALFLIGCLLALNARGQSMDFDSDELDEGAAREDDGAGDQAARRPAERVFHPLPDVDIEDGQPRRQVIALVTHSGAVDSPTLAVLELGLRQALTERKDVALGDLLRILDSSPDSSGRKLIERAREAFRRGVDHYNNLEAPEAISALTTAQQLYERAAREMPSSREIVDVLVYLASVLNQTGRSSEAAAHYQMALFLDPRLELDPYLFPPDDIAALEEMRRTIAELPTGSVSISSQPGAAHVYMDWSYRGVTPLQLGPLPQGQHFVHIMREGYVVIGGILDVNANRSNEITYNLMPIPGYADLLAQAQKADPSRPDLGGVAATLAEQLPGEDLVLLHASPGRDDKEVAIDLHLVDLNRGVRLNRLDARLPTSASKIAPALKPLLTELLDVPRPAEGGLAVPVATVDDAMSSGLPLVPVAIGVGIGATVIAGGVVLALLAASSPQEPAALSGSRRVAVLGF